MATENFFSGIVIFVMGIITVFVVRIEWPMMMNYYSVSWLTARFGKKQTKAFIATLGIINIIFGLIVILDSLFHL